MLRDKISSSQTLMYKSNTLSLSSSMGDSYEQLLQWKRDIEDQYEEFDLKNRKSVMLIKLFMIDDILS